MTNDCCFQFSLSNDSFNKAVHAHVVFQSQFSNPVELQQFYNTLFRENIAFRTFIEVGCGSVFYCVHISLYV